MKIEIPEIMTGTSLLIGEPYKEERRRKILLLILDGWGANDDSYGNLIMKANTFNMDKILRKYPNVKLTASGEPLGMPEGTVGNSEIGHLHLGAGRKVPSDRVRINLAIEDGSFFENKAFINVLNKAKDANKALHLLGIVSFYSSHGSIDHLNALMKMAKDNEVENLYIHAILGRRGEKPESGAIYLEEIEKECERLGLGRVVTAIGRHWVLDREENWDRIEKSYRTLVHGEGNKKILE
jgi:2,3-bisphosphoglycerate-independent phosphoglycerate mutase